MALTIGKYVIPDGAPAGGNQTTQSASFGDADITPTIAHLTNTSDPHNVTATQVGLGNVDNTSDADKPVSTATQTELDTKITPTQAAAGTDNNQTGLEYILALTDQENTTVWMSNSNTNAVTIPLAVTVAFPIGTKINIMMEGVGETTVKADPAVTLNGVLGGSIVINNQFQGVAITKRGANAWVAAGDYT